MSFPSKEEIESLTTDQQIETIKRLRLNNRIIEMATGFGFNSSSNYYNWLKKLGIYEELNSRIYKVFSEPDEIEKRELFSSLNQSAKQEKQIFFSNEQIMIKYDLVENGSSVADLLRKIANFIEQENSQFSLHMRISNLT